MRISDWSSDVCSSDLRCARAGHEGGSIESAVSRTGWRALTRTAAAPGRRGLPCRKPGQSGPEGNVMAAATLFEKLWQRHVVHEPEAGPPLLYMDRHLVYEVTSPQAFEGLRMGRSEEHTSELQSL